MQAKSFYSLKQQVAIVAAARAVLIQETLALSHKHTLAYIVTQILTSPTAWVCLSACEIGHAAGVQFPNVCMVTKRLVAKGLIFKCLIKGQKNRYALGPQLTAVLRDNQAHGQALPQGF